MDKQKQIQEMARKICKSSSNGCNFPTCSKCGIKDTCKALTYATRAINVGYFNLKEFVLRLKRKIRDEGFDQLCQDCSASEQDVFDWIDELSKEYLNG